MLNLNDLTFFYLRCRSACVLLALRNFRLLLILSILLMSAKAALLRSPLWVGTALQLFYFDAKSVFLMDRNLCFFRPHEMFTAL